MPTSALLFKKALPGAKATKQPQQSRGGRPGKPEPATLGPKLPSPSVRSARERCVTRTELAVPATCMSTATFSPGHNYSDHVIPHCDCDPKDSKAIFFACHKIANQLFCKTFRLAMMHHHVKFGYKRLSCSEDIGQDRTDTVISFYPFPSFVTGGIANCSTRLSLKLCNEFACRLIVNCFF